MPDVKYAPPRRVSRGRQIIFAKELGLSVGLFGRNLGDCWWAVNRAVHLHLQHQHPVGIHVMVWLNKKLYSCRPLLEDIISQLDLPYVPELIGDGIAPGTSFHFKNFPHVPTHYVSWPFPISYFSTKQRPVVRPFDAFSYQLYGVSSRWRQSFSRPYGIKMVQRMQALGLQERRVGLPLNLAQSIDVMCTSRCHVGIDSGMTHMARSVGVPTFVYQGRLTLAWIGSWHQLHSIQTFRTIEELETLLASARLLPQKEVKRAELR